MIDIWVLFVHIYFKTQKTGLNANNFDIIFSSEPTTSNFNKSLITRCAYTHNVSIKMYKNLKKCCMNAG